ncbi:MAG: ral secretion pathway protein [Variibacter sp.]|jgi:general secretion pathway protein J|nr:ral secretion pathway protein [Variibacter sp.]
MKRTALRSRCAGFTLVEALVASFLMAIIVGALGTVTAQWMPNWNRGFARVQRVDQLTAGLERLVADLGAAEVVSTGEGKGFPAFQGDELSVTFVRTALGPNAGHTLELVRIAEVGAEAGPTLIRSTAPFLPVNSEAPTVEVQFTKPVVVIRPPYRISFAYTGTDGAWQSSWRDESALPRAMKIDVRDRASSKVLVSTVSPIHAEIPVACISAQASAQCGAAGSTNQLRAGGGNPNPGASGMPTPTGGGGPPIPTGGGGGVPIPTRPR